MLRQQPAEGMETAPPARPQLQSEGELSDESPIHTPASSPPIGLFDEDSEEDPDRPTTSLRAQAHASRRDEVAMHSSPQPAGVNNPPRRAEEPEDVKPEIALFAVPAGTKGVRKPKGRGNLLDENPNANLLYGPALPPTPSV